MCGLVGSVGKKPVLKIILSALRQMENRGYDSSGACVMNGGPPLLRARALRPEDGGSSVNSLAVKIGEERPETIGLGHTRWASHGLVCIENAHPHFDCTETVAIGHNGNIENYDDLLPRLNRTHRIVTDVDSELIAHLIEEYRREYDLVESVRRAYRDLVGALGLVVMSAHDQGCLIAVRRSSPMLIGQDDDGTYALSEQSGFPRTVKDFVELKDNEMAILRADGYKIEALDGHTVSCHANAVDQSVHDERPAYYKDDTHWEIHSEPKAVREAIAGRVQADEGTVKLGGLESVSDRLGSVRDFVLIGCGTAYHACMHGARMLSSLTGIPAQAQVASEFIYDGHHVGPATAVVAVSQSGETADTRQALEAAQRRGALTIGIVNAVGSAIARETEAGIYTRAGRERGVASTKAFLSQIITLAMLTIYVGRQRMTLAADEARRITQAMVALPSQLELILENEFVVSDLAHLVAETERGCIFIGRGMSHAVALEGALKLLEISYLFTKGCPSGELKHGYLALVDKNTPTVAIMPRDRTYDHALISVNEVKTRQGPIIAIGDASDARLHTVTSHIIGIPETHETLHPVLTACVTHLLAYHVAKLLGRDIDRPRCLAKAVTVT